MKDIMLYGAGGHCHAAIALIKSLGEYDPILVFDDSPVETEIIGVQVKKYEGSDLSNKSLYVAIGNNNTRMKLAERFVANFPIFVHNSATVYPSVTIGKGSMVHPNVVLDAEVTVGEFCIINNNATVSHNVKIGNYVHVAIQAAIAGGVSIGEGALIGAGSVIIPEVKIGKWATIGAGSVVTKDVPDFATVYGNPARIIKYNDGA